MLDLAALKQRAATRRAGAGELANVANWLTVAKTDPAPISQLANLATSHAPHGSDANADRYCWPHSDAMNTAEIARFLSLKARHMRSGKTEDEADRLADAQVLGERENRAGTAQAFEINQPISKGRT